MANVEIGAMKISFLGAAETVTGSHFLVEEGDVRILVDCGLYQEGSFCEPRNINTFPYDPKSITALCITHAHLDHVGRIPKLVHEGFRGAIIATPPTLDLTVLTLRDTLHILEAREDEECPPLFQAPDLDATIPLFRPTLYDAPIDLGGGVTVTLLDAGHILGSSMVAIESQGKRVVFTGDIGNAPTPLLNNPTPIGHADAVIMDSTYGARNHDDREGRQLRLERVIEDTVTRGGVLLMPAFALERTQELLAELNDLIENHRIPSIPVYIDSPLAIHATEIYKKYPEFMNAEAQKHFRSGNSMLQFLGLHFTLKKEESKAINNVPAPKVIIAGSGDSMAGRILHHERLYLPDPKSTLFVVGYQNRTSRGRALVDGAKEVRIFGERVTVRAHVEHMSGYSAHADQDALFNLIATMENRPGRVFAVHGSVDSSHALAVRIRDSLGINATVPKMNEVFEL